MGVTHENIPDNYGDDVSLSKAPLAGQWIALSNVNISMEFFVHKPPQPKQKTVSIISVGSCN